MPRILSLARRVLACAFTMLSLAAWGFSQSVTVTPRSNAPTAHTLVSGSGFSADADVDIYFDSDDLALAVTDGTGSFSRIALQVPASALPGEHTVSAVERSTGASAQTPFWVNTRWAQFRKRATHNGYNVGEHVLSPSTVGSLGLLWKYTTGGVVGSSPAVANGMVYVGSSDGSIYALNAVSGHLRWKHDTGRVFSSPAVANGVVYVQSEDGNVYALNAVTGAVRWKYQIAAGGTATFSSPTVANGVVYVGSNDGNGYALNASTGAVRWKYKIAPGGQNTSSPAVANGLVYIGSEFGTVYALNAVTGALRWKYGTGRSIDLSPAVANGVVYVGSVDGSFYALSAVFGHLRWKYQIDGTYIESSPAVANGVVYVGSDDRNVYALNASTGAQLWKYTTGSYLDSSPAVANGVVYIGSYDGNLYAFGLTGSAAPAVPERPDPQTLSPNLSLPVSGPATKLPLTDDE